MKKVHKFLVLTVLLLTAPNLWAQPPDLPEGACVTPEVSEWGLVAMAGILGIVGFMVIRRRKVTA